MTHRIGKEVEKRMAVPFVAAFALAVPSTSIVTIAVAFEPAVVALDVALGSAAQIVHPYAHYHYLLALGLLWPQHYCLQKWLDRWIRHCWARCRAQTVHLPWNGPWNYSNRNSAAALESIAVGEASAVVEVAVGF